MRNIFDRKLSYAIKKSAIRCRRLAETEKSYQAEHRNLLIRTVLILLCKIESIRFLVLMRLKEILQKHI